MTALFRLLARAPLPLMQALGGLLGWAVWALAPDYRRRFRENAAQAGLTPAQWRPAIAAAGRMAAELPWLWARPAGESVLPRVRQWTGDEALDAALASGRGAIVISPHLGCWELLGQALGERFLASHGPITALFRPPRKPWMAALMEGSRDRPGLHMLPTDVSGVRGLMRALKKGGYTGILPDQVPPAGQGVWAPFFGRPAYTMTLVPRLAQLTGAQVFLGVCERLPHGRGYAVRLQPLQAPALADPKASPEEAATAMNQGIEQLILSLPGQYVWDYARYKAPRAEMETAR